jgi:hypothetical protein
VFLSKDAILCADDITLEVVEIPEWGGNVNIRTMTGAQRDALENRIRDDKQRDVRAYVAVACACDEQGNQLFTKADIQALSKKSGKALDRIFEAAIALNKISKEDVDALAGE